MPTNDLRNEKGQTVGGHESRIKRDRIASHLISRQSGFAIETVTLLTPGKQRPCQPHEKALLLCSGQSSASAAEPRSSHDITKFESGQNCQVLQIISEDGRRKSV
jgi:hypothetical protein